MQLEAALEKIYELTEKYRIWLFYQNKKKLEDQYTQAPWMVFKTTGRKNIFKRPRKK